MRSAYCIENGLLESVAMAVLGDSLTTVNFRSLPPWTRTSGEIAASSTRPGRPQVAVVR